MSRPVRALLILAGVVGLAVLLATFVFPTRQYLDQRDEIASTEETLEALQGEVASLEEQIAEMNDPVEFERVAREQLALVQPGDELYRLAVDPDDALDLPDTWPLPGVRKMLTGE